VRGKGGGGGGGGSSLGGDFGVPPVAELPAFLQEVLQTFQEREMESQGEDPLRGHAARGLGAFLIASSRASTQVQDDKSRRAPNQKAHSARNRIASEVGRPSPN